MADVKFSWFENFYGLAWRTHAGNPIAVPEEYRFEQSVNQYFYFVTEASIQDITNSYSSKIDNIFSVKEAEIMTV